MFLFFQNNNIMFLLREPNYYISGNFQQLFLFIVSLGTFLKFSHFYIIISETVSDFSIPSLVSILLKNNFFFSNLSRLF